MDKFWRLIIILLLLMPIYSSAIKQLIFPQNERRYYKIDPDTASYFDICGSGDEVEHRIVRARVTLPIDFDKSKFVDYSRRILDYDLKSKAERQKIKSIWVEFYLLEHPGDDREGSKPYRFRYFRDGDAWVWLARATNLNPRNTINNQN